MITTTALKWGVKVFRYITSVKREWNISMVITGGRCAVDDIGI